MKKENLLAETLKGLGLSRADLAELMGISVKTTYWAEPPKAAITILELYRQTQQYRALKLILRHIVNDAEITHLIEETMTLDELLDS